MAKLVPKNPRKVRKQRVSQEDLAVSLQPDTEHKACLQTKLRINEVAKKISKGWTKFETIEWIKTEFEIGDASAKRYWEAAMAKLAVKAQDSEYVEEMRKKTIATLDRMIQSELQEGKYKEANQTSDLLSRLLGYNVSKSEVKVQGDISFRFGTPEDNNNNTNTEEGKQDA